MTRLHGIIVVLAAALVAVWGCGQTPPSAANNSKSLETRVAKLEQELKVALDARDSAKAQVVDLDRKLKAEQARVIGIERERDELRLSLTARTSELMSRTSELKTRTTELDTATAKFHQLHKGLKELVGQMDTTASPQLPAGAPASVRTASGPNGL